ncbi:pinin [Thrips palmi]|uniref:Pinin n=1 Tax=Thrips palmi TaxID=161013 RepID=A0A6P8ZYQ3_THRPL|nr:pinin [Thrips palmi]
MATEVLKTFSALQDELQKAKEGLRNVDSHIKRIIGRDPEAQPPGQGPPRPGQKRPATQNDDFYARGRGSFQMGGGRGRIGHPGRPQEDEGPPGIRRRLGDGPGNVFSRLSGPPIKHIKKEKDDEFPGPFSKFYRREEQEEEEIEEDDAQFKPAISSRVIPQTRELPSKEVILAAQGDERSKARNRRMFGALLGTLQRFRQEETRMRDREDKRAVVEKKLEEAAKREKEEMKKERQELFLDRRKKQQEIRRIETKIQRVKEQDQWEARHRPLLNFIQTKAKPSIFYLPKVQNTKTEERLVASQKVIAKIMEKKRTALQEELERLEGNVQVKTENAGEQHFEDEEEEEMNTENGPTEDNEELQEVTGDSPVENKENRIRFANVKVEKDSEPVQSDPEDKQREGDHSTDNHRQPSNVKRVRESRENLHDRPKDRQRRDPQDDRDRAREKESARERGKERDRGNERDRDRMRERGSRMKARVEAKKEEEEKWDRKRERHNSSDTNAMEEEDEADDNSAIPPPELSSISLPGEQSPSFMQPELGELDDASE